LEQNDTRQGREKNRRIEIEIKYWFWLSQK
jgi:flagellar motor protein MotB